MREDEAGCGWVCRRTDGPNVLLAAGPLGDIYLLDVVTDDASGTNESYAIFKIVAVSGSAGGLARAALTTNWVAALQYRCCLERMHRFTIEAPSKPSPLEGVKYGHYLCVEDPGGMDISICGKSGLILTGHRNSTLS